ncbi:DUF4150 domain-containing protein [Pyxidicoccus fallax]|uniref:DUF4150 domain-containing protein n=1 Tax=Pyxidicoccus fallax TaxID=394095 RepID=A0A848L5Z0_9BACT|nr:DUF4150 domain-containing protein [Pyxidicoccus fallax]NMO14360.1 DUF4150 domain-containing protein [Pyxidicoccus fallax]NPC77149.1 DUF4150 domain-containing protein [Pyxidicoccus fallax]
MATKVGVNQRTVVHKDSGGVTIAAPDVCLTPAPPAPPVPIPYPNIAKSADTDKAAKSVTVDGNPMCHAESVFSTSTGDEAGTNKGVASGKTQGKAEFVSYSFDVKVEGKGAARALDLMLHNDKNTPPAPLVQPPLVAILPPEPEEKPKEWKLVKIEVL